MGMGSLTNLLGWKCSAHPTALLLAGNVELLYLLVLDATPFLETVSVAPKLTEGIKRHTRKQRGREEDKGRAGMTPPPTLAPEPFLCSCKSSTTILTLFGLADGSGESANLAHSSKPKVTSCQGVARCWNCLSLPQPKLSQSLRHLEVNPV